MSETAKIYLKQLKERVKERKEYRESLRREIQTLVHNDKDLCTHTLAQIDSLISRLFNVDTQYYALSSELERLEELMK